VTIAAPDVTGEFTAVWSPSDTGTWRVRDNTGALRAVLHVDDLDEFERDPNRPEILLVGDTRYLIGLEHPDRPGHRYVHRLNRA
jgi:hypothetical protein